MNTCRATLDDLDALLADVRAGFDSYVAFAPEGWRSPDAARHRERSAELLIDSRTWALVARDQGRTVGHVAFTPARERGSDAQPAQGYEPARLFTPSQHARARRFYERRGWTDVAQDWSEDLALMLTECRVSLEQYPALTDGR